MSLKPDTRRDYIQAMVPHLAAAWVTFLSNANYRRTSNPHEIMDEANGLALAQAARLVDRLHDKPPNFRKDIP